MRRSTPSVKCRAPYEIAAIHPDVSAKWLRVPAGRQMNGTRAQSGCNHHGQRSVSAGDPERVRAYRHGLLDERREPSSGRRTITLIPRSRARPARPARAAFPSPDLGFSTMTGGRGRPAAVQVPGVIRSEGTGASGEVVWWVARDRARGDVHERRNRRGERDREHNRQSTCSEIREGRRSWAEPYSRPTLYAAGRGIVAVSAFVSLTSSGALVFPDPVGRGFGRPRKSEGARLVHLLLRGR